MHHHHEELIVRISAEFKEILDSSSQGIYIYLDDVHKVCSKKFASLLGYESPKEWENITESFPSAFVAEKSQEELIKAYQKAIEHSEGSTISVVWKTKKGSEIKTKVILVPIMFEGHKFALHFVSKYN